MTLTDRLVYVASPYTDSNPSVRAHRFEETRRFTGWLLSQRVMALSPIVHAHQIAIDHALPFDFEYWAAFNDRLIAASEAVAVLCLPGWRSSRGVAHEIALAHQREVPIFYFEHSPDGHSFKGVIE